MYRCCSPVFANFPEKFILKQRRLEFSVGKRAPPTGHRKKIQIPNPGEIGPFFQYSFYF
jgi:hypothetical protein